MHHKKFTGGDFSNKFPQNATRMRTMVGPGADMSFKGGDYSNKFPQNANRMRTMVGPGADMSFVGGSYSDKFPVHNPHTNEQAGFSRASNFGNAGTLNDGMSYFRSNNHDSFNPRNNHSNASGLEYGSQSNGRTLSGSSNPLMEVGQSGNSIQRIPVSTGLDGNTARKKRKNVVTGAASPGAVAARQTGGSNDCTPPNVWCQSGDYAGCHPQHKCNGGGARQVNKKSRRGSVDRISVNPVGGAARESGGCKPTKCGHYNNASCPAGCRCSSTYNGICKGGGGGFTGAGAKVTRGAKQMNASGCGYNNFHHKSSFSSNISKYNTFR